MASGVLQRAQVMQAKCVSPLQACKCSKLHTHLPHWYTIRFTLFERLGCDKAVSCCAVYNLGWLLASQE